VVHGSGGRLVGGAILLDDVDDTVHALRPGEVVEVTAGAHAPLQTTIARLCHALRTDHLSAVSVGRLMQDAGRAA
jgi:transcription antitermination factor NusG